MSALVVPTAAFSGALDARIQRYSHMLAWLLLVIAALLPVAAIWSIWHTPPAEWARAAGVVGEAARQAQQHALTGPREWLFSIVTLAPVFLASAALLVLRVTFIAFSHGLYFSGQATAGLRNFALLVGAACIGEIMLTPLQTVLLTWANGDGQRQLVFSLSSSHVLTLLTVLCVWVVAWVFGQAAALQDENRQFV